jgi:hypothetical protein
MDVHPQLIEERVFVLVLSSVIAVVRDPCA